MVEECNVAPSCETWHLPGAAASPPAGADEGAVALHEAAQARYLNRHNQAAEGDAVLAAQPGSTRASIVFFSNFGVAYTCRIIDVPASTGYGEPVQSLFRLKDGERIVAALSLDPRLTPGIKAATEGEAPPAHAVAVTSDGYSLRFGLDGLAEPSTRAGRRFARPTGGAEVVGVSAVRGTEVIIAVTREARAVLCKVDEIN